MLQVMYSSLKAVALPLSILFNKFYAYLEFIDVSPKTQQEVHKMKQLIHFLLSVCNDSAGTCHSVQPKQHKDQGDTRSNLRLLSLSPKAIQCASQAEFRTYLEDSQNLHIISKQPQNHCL